MEQDDEDAEGPEADYILVFEERAKAQAREVALRLHGRNAHVELHSRSGRIELHVWWLRR